jgi:hypothetical protein
MLRTLVLTVRSVAHFPNVCLNRARPFGDDGNEGCEGAWTGKPRNLPYAFGAPYCFGQNASRKFELLSSDGRALLLTKDVASKIS